MRITFFFLVAALLQNSGASAPAFKIGRTRLQLATSLAVNRNTFYLAQLDMSQHPTRLTSRVRTFIYDSTLQTAHPSSWYPPATARRIISPIAVRTDNCNRLWVLDCGVTGIMGKQNRTSIPSIQVFDIKKNITLRSHPIESDLLSADSFLTTFALDIPNCDDTFAYIADFNRPALLIYDFHENSMRLVNHHYFHPDPVSKIPRDLIFNKKYIDMSGIFGLAVKGDSLFFHPMASKNEFFVPTSVLRAKDTSTYHDFGLDTQRPTEAGVEIYATENQVRFFSEFNRIACVGNNNEYVQLQEGQQVGQIWDLAVNGSDLWLLTNEDDSYNAKKFDIPHLISQSACYDASINMHRLDLDDINSGNTGEVLKSNDWGEDPIGVISMGAIGALPQFLFILFGLLVCRIQ